MNRVFAACSALTLIVPAGALAEPESVPITLTAAATTISATLNDTPTARDFLRSLPRTMAMTRWGEREYYGKVGTPLSVEAPQQTGFRNGDIAYWVPGGSFAVFFDDTRDTNISDLIVIGRVGSDLSAFNALGATVDMRIERVGGAPTPSAP
jgi:hypothetical protein